MSTRGRIWVFGLSASVTLLILAASCAGEPPERSQRGEPEGPPPVERRSPAEADRLEIVASQGQVDFALVPAEVAEDPGAWNGLRSATVMRSALASVGS